MQPSRTGAAESTESGGTPPPIRVAYEVTARVRADLQPEYERYMIEAHIPDLLATGFFHSATFGTAGDGRYRVRYESTSRDALDDYLSSEAPRLREHFDRHFPEGVDVSREVWEMLQSWTHSALDTGNPPRH